MAGPVRLDERSVEHRTKPGFAAQIARFRGNVASFRRALRRDACLGMASRYGRLVLLDS